MDLTLYKLILKHFGPEQALKIYRAHSDKTLFVINSLQKETTKKYGLNMVVMSPDYSEAIESQNLYFHCEASYPWGVTYGFFYYDGEDTKFFLGNSKDQQYVIGSKLCINTYSLLPKKLMYLKSEKDSAWLYCLYNALLHKVKRVDKTYDPHEKLILKTAEKFLYIKSKFD